MVLDWLEQLPAGYKWYLVPHGMRRWRHLVLGSAISTVGKESDLLLPLIIKYCELEIDPEIHESYPCKHGCIAKWK